MLKWKSYGTDPAIYTEHTDSQNDFGISCNGYKAVLGVLYILWQERVEVDVGPSNVF